MPNLHNASVPFQIKYSARPSSPQRPTAPTSKILPLFSRKTTRPPPPSPVNNALLPPEIRTAAAPRAYPRFPPPNYTPFEQQCRTFAPPVTMRSSVPVFSAPPPRAMPVCIRQAVPPSAAAPPLKKAEETAATSNADEAAAARCLEKLEIWSKNTYTYTRDLSCYITWWFFFMVLVVFLATFFCLIYSTNLFLEPLFL